MFHSNVKGLLSWGWFNLFLLFLFCWQQLIAVCFVLMGYLPTVLLIWSPLRRWCNLLLLKLCRYKDDISLNMVNSVVNESGNLTGTFLPSVSNGLPTLQELQFEQQQCQKQQGCGYQFIDGFVFYIGRLWVPEPLHLRILSTFHDSCPYLHPGAWKTKAEVFCMSQPS